MKLLQISRRALLCGLSLCGTAVPIQSLAGGEEMRDELRALKERIQSLEEQLARRPTSRSEGQTDGSWTDRITLSGVVEVEASYMDTPDGSESDIVLATVELGIDAQITDWVNAHLLILFEEDDTEPPDLDEGVITIGNTEVSPFYLAAGRMYVPFGNFESNLISDPLTLEIGETRETALQLGYESQGFYGSFFVYNGDTKDGGDKTIEHFGVNFGLAQEAGDSGLGYDLGLSYVNNIADSDSLQDAMPDPKNLADTVSGIGVHAIVTTDPFMFIGEYLAATDSFDAAALAFKGSGAEPKAWNLEAAYGFELAGKEATFALAYQGTDEAVALELPEKRYLAALSVGIMQQTSLSLEWAHDEDYETAEGGTGDDTETITLQLAAEF